MKKATTPLGLLVADNVPAMLAYWDKDLKCRYANDAYLDWFGKTSAEMIGEMTIIDLLGATYGPYEPNIKGALAGLPQEMVLVLPLPDGDIKHYLQVSLIPDLDQDGLKGIVMYAADITPVKVLEKQVEHSNEVIRSQNRSLLNFANIVTHDLRGYTFNLESLLGMFEVETAEEEKRKILDSLKDLSGIFKSTVKNLSDIVSVQNHGDVPMEEVNLYECVAKATEVLGPQIKASNAVVKVNVSPFVYIHANPAYLESIVYNFLSNAIKYKHPERDPVVELSTMVVANETILSIKDNGRGIDLTKHKAELFGMYKTFHGNEDATGIGLFISKYQVDSMGGRIGVESLVNRGTWFRIYFQTRTATLASEIKMIS
jgi:signal transduction histidine kinase